MTKKSLYRKMLRKCKKDLKAFAKSYRPWDYGHLIEVMLIIFKNWENYYKLGYNVHAAEGNIFEEDIPTREQIAKTLFEKLNVVDGVDTLDPQKELKDFSDYFSEYLRYMWD